MDVFSEYVRSLDPAGEPPDAGSFAEVWAALGRVLRSELRKRGLWDSPPSYLGVVGWESWRQGEAGDGGGPLEDLLADCYSFIFIRRLASLKAQLKVKLNVEGLVFVNIRHFLHELQKKHDPLGFRVFEILRAAVRGAVGTRQLFVLAGDAKIANATVLGFSPEAEARPDLSVQLGGVVSRWNDSLLPELVTAQGKARERLVERLQGLLRWLPGDGVEVFRFQQVIDPLKSDVRARWAALHGAAEGETAVEGDGELREVVRLIQPDTGIEERDSFEKLLACVVEGLERRCDPPPVQGYLSTLWESLWIHAAGSGGAAARRVESIAAAVELDSDKLPSGRRLATLLRIPRDRLPQLFAVLRELVDGCRAAISENRPVSSECMRHQPNPVRGGTQTERTVP